MHYLRRISAVAATALLAWCAYGLGTSQARQASETSRRVAISQACQALSQALKSQSEQPTIDGRQVCQFVLENLEQAGVVEICNADGVALARATTPAALPGGRTPAPAIATWETLRLPLKSSDPSWRELRVLLIPAAPAEFAWQQALPVARHIKTVPVAILTIVALLGPWFVRRRNSGNVVDTAAPVPNASLEILREGFVVLDAHQRIVSSNPAFSELVGVSDAALAGRPINDFAWLQQDWQGGFPWETCLRTGKRLDNCELQRRDAQGQIRSLVANVAPVLDASGNARGVIVSCEDVTDIQQRDMTVLQLLNRLENSRHRLEQQEEKLRHNLAHDKLTGLLDRATLLQTGYQLVADAQSSRPTSCIVCGLDGFREFNKKHGVDTGDQVIRAFARFLTQDLPPDAICGRLAGEQFSILLPATDLNTATEYAESLRRNLATTELGPGVITASFGVAATHLATRVSSPRHQEPMTCEMLLEQAEEAMAQAKRWGRNQVRRADQLEQPDTTPSYQQLIAQTWHRDGHAAPDPRTTHALLMVIRRCRPDLAEHSTRVADLCVGLSTGILSPPDVAVLQTVALLHELDQLGTLAGTENATERVEAAAIRRATSPVNTRAAAPHNKQRYVDALGLVSPPVADEILFAAFGSPRMMAVLTAFRLPTFQHRGMLIPLGARILKLAHAFDELVYPPGGGGLDSLAALEELRAQTDTKFEPALVERLAGYLKHFHTADRSPNGLGREPSTDMGSPTATQVAVAPTPAQ